MPAPCAAEPPAGPQAAGQPSAPLRTLLYIEDNPDNVLLFEALMANRQDIRLLTATDGQRGIELARAAKPDVILMDIRMPGMSGTEALGILREDPSTASIPVIALSANAMPGDIQTALALGFARHLTKPIDVNQLTAALDAVLKTVRTH